MTNAEKKKLFQSVADRLTPIASELQSFSNSFDADSEDAEGKMAGKTAQELITYIGRYTVLAIQQDVE